MNKNLTRSPDGGFIISEKDFEELIEKASEKGARKALNQVGLDDAHAGIDIRDLRELLKALRMAKKDGFRILVRWVVIGIMTLITAGFISIISK